ncbi:tyrosine-type recombinase/integrase [Bifidobacterium sp. SO1]|uniref:tyrosine-type recombinase/integrase n=1 Tax=Bifidobacterium sp. SO1 TaxID=2809029 RepID=UPI001BDC3C4A|nr:tyrosine-type recombinase/integrase [Bifidobacterium sp. SO1]MBT1161288.1 tyrosine-type recombinase/integrase [Bifidobacterium sp. SO1]
MPRQRRTGSIYPVKYTVKTKRKDGTVAIHEYWHAKVDGKWVSGKTFKACDEKIKAKLRERGEWGMLYDRKTTLGEYLDKWFEAKGHTLDPGSIELYQSVTNVHLPRYRDVKLADVTPSLLRRLFANMRNLDGTPTSQSRRKVLLSVLNQVFDCAVADRIIPTSPVTKGLVPKEKDEKLSPIKTGTLIEPKPNDDDKEDESMRKDERSRKQNRHAFTPQEMIRMLEASTDDIMLGTRHWWRLLMGMRQSEILGITLDDLKLWRNVQKEQPGGPEIWVGQYTANWKLEQLNRRHGCGERDKNGLYPCGYKMPSKCPYSRWVAPDDYDMIPLCGRFALTPPKSHRGKTIPVVNQLAEVTRRYLEATKDIPNPYNLLFRTLEGMPIDATDDRATFRDLMRKAGIPDPEHRYGHECRNSAATILFSMGVDPGIIQRILGHSSIAMSEHYRTVPIEELFAGMETIGEKLDLEQIEWKEQS